MATLVTKTSDASSVGGFSGAYTFKLEVIENSTSIANNTSSVTINHYIKGNSGFYYEEFSTPKSTITVDSSTKKTTTVSDVSTSWKKIGTWTGNISHSSNGTKSISVSVNYNPNTSSYEYLPKSNTITATVTLTTIPRTSSITVPTSVTIGQACAVTISRASTSFTHTIKYSCGDWNVSRTGKTTSDSYTIPMLVCNQITTSTSKAMTVTCYTYNGSTLIGSTSKNVTLNVPTSVVPTVDNFLVNEAVYGLATQFNAYIRGKSKVTVDVSGSGTYGAGISSYKIKIGSTTYNGYTATSGILYDSSYSIVATVTDSRGRSTSSTKTITTVKYSAPTSSMSVARCTSDGTLSDDGTYVKITYSYNIESIGNKNTKSCVIQHLDGTEWTTIETLTDYSGNTSIVKGTYSSDVIHKFRIVATDYFTSSTSNVDLSTAFTLINFKSNGKGLAFGKVSESNQFECALPAKFTGGLKLSDTLPANALLRNSSNNTGLWYISTKLGALCATETNGFATFKTLPVNCGGTGVTTIDDLKTALGITPQNIISNSSVNWNTSKFDSEITNCYYYPMMNMIYVRMSSTVKSGQTITAGTEITVGSIQKTISDIWYPLTVYCSKQVTSIAVKDTTNRIRIKIKPLVDLGAGYFISIAGWIPCV